MDARQQLLQSLMRDLENFELPERYTAAQKAQIEKNRKGQKDIDAGRAAIAENERLYQEAATKRGQLQERIRTLQGEIETVSTKAKQDDPVNQAIQYGKSFGVPAAGYVGGHIAGHGFGKVFDTDPAERGANVKRLADGLRGIDKSNPASKAQVSAIIDTYDKAKKGRPLIQFAGPAGLGAMSVATQMGAQYADDPYLKEGLNLAATAERTGAGGMMLQQLYDTLRGNQKAKKATDQADVASIESARRQLNEGGKFKHLQGALDPTAKPAALPEPEAPALRTPSDRLISAARAAGAKGKLTKKTAAEWLTSANINDANRAAVASELGVGPGQRIASAVKRLSTSRTPSSLIGPLAAAGLAYDSASSEAEAAGATPGEARTRGAVAGTGAAGVAAAGGYALNKLAQIIPPVARNALSVAGSAMVPMMAADAYDPTDAELNRDRIDIAYRLPESMRFGALEEAGRATQVPERNPLALAGEQARRGPLMKASALELPTNIPPNANQQADIAAGMTPGAPPNALAVAGKQPDAFGLALKDFLAFVAEEQAGQQGAEQ